MPTQTGSIDFKSTKGFKTYAEGQYATQGQVTTLNTAIEQNASDIALRATKTEASQMAQPNLSPYFTSSPYEASDYWLRMENTSPYTFTDMGDGWMRVQCTNNGSSVIRRDWSPVKSPSVKPGVEYTWLAEIRNNKSTGTSSNTDFYLVQTANCQFWGQKATKTIEGPTGTGMSISLITCGESYVMRKMQKSETAADGHWTDGDEANVIGLACWTFRCAANATIDYEVRLSVYEGEYTGPYKPYVGSQLYASQAELKVANDEISSKVSKDGIISSINQSAETVKIQASKVEIDGTAVFKVANAIPDTRNDNRPPSWYFTNYPQQSVTEFKTSSVMGLTGEIYCYVTTVTGWRDSSGGYPKQTAQIAGKTYWRVGTSASAWGAWQETESTTGAQNKANEAVSNLEIGGRNLLVDSSTGNGWGKSTFDATSCEYTRSTTATTESYVLAKTMTFEPGETYTLSCWAKSNGYVTSLDVFKVHSSGGGSHQSRTQIPLTTEYQRVVWTFTCDATTTETAYIRFDNNGSTTSGTEAILYIKEPKLEKGNKATDWTPAPEDVASSIDSVYDKIRSQGIQLVTNGNGFMRDNTNWPGLRFDGSKANGSPGSFTKSVGYTTIFSEEAFPVDVSKEYLFEFDAMSDGGTGVLYSFLATLDSDKNLIDAFNVMYYQNTLTTLASDLNPGDTTVKLTSAANFVTTTATHQRTLTFWDYSNSSGYTYPAETYSRNVYSNIYADDTKVDKSTGVITLKSAWTGPKKAAGTQVSQGHSGGTYVYNHVGIKIPSTWTHYSALISGLDTVKDGSDATGKFRQGTAFAKVGFLWNYNNSNQGQIWVTNISVKEASANLSSSVKRTQRIWYRKSAAGAPATPGTASSNWVVKADDGSNAWTKMHVAISSTEKFIYTCEQYEMGDGTVGYTSVLLDNTITVIDGGNIITGTVTANQIAAGTITAEEIAGGTITSDNIAAGAISADRLDANALTLGNIEGLEDRLNAIDSGLSSISTETQWVHYDPDKGTVFGENGSANNLLVTGDGIDFNTDEGRAAWATGGVFHANEMEAETVEAQTIVMGNWALVQSGTSFYIDYIG